MNPYASVFNSPAQGGWMLIKAFPKKYYTMLLSDNRKGQYQHSGCVPQAALL